MTTTSVYQQSLVLLREAILEQGTYLDPVIMRVFTEYLAEKRVGFRWYYLSRDVVKTTLWPELRVQETLLDLVLAISSDWRCRLEGLFATANSEIGSSDFYTHAKYCDVITSALSGIAGYDNTGNSQVVDDEFVSKIEVYPEVLRLLKSEGWLLVLVVMSMNLRYFMTLLQDMSNSKVGG